jgi:CDP-paratose synthetase
MDKRKTILLTGATGFLGGHLLNTLAKKNYKIIITKRNNSNTSLIKNALKLKNVKAYNIERIEIEKLFNNNIDIIIHTATSYGRTGETKNQIKKANYTLPLDLLKLGIKNNTSLFINSDTFLTKKNDTSPKNHNYITTKKDFLTKSKKIIKGTNINFANLIIEHMYGPADNPSKIIPWLIKKLLKNPASLPLNNGKQKRDFIYVDDVINAFIKTIEHSNKLPNYTDFGIGTGKPVTFKTLVKNIKKHSKAKTVLAWGKYPTDSRDCSFSSAKKMNNKKIGWKPTFSLNAGIKKTVEHYKKSTI